LEQRGWRLRVKQTFDRAAAAAGLVLAAPVLGATAAVIRATMGSPVFFTQERPGLHGKPFRIVKFRTMRHATDRDGRLLPDAERLTAVGKLIRSTSLDELPQLWNVLRGELSLVGPRPLLMKYLPLYTPEQARRHDVLPGITGWSVIHERNAAPWPQKLRRDLEYVDNWSLALDAKILALTAFRVLRRSGISQPGHATMPDFTGES
jgi:sugar transferase EpsL